MEIHNQPIPGPRPNRRSFSEEPIDITRKNREGIQQLKQDYEDEQNSTDSIELSSEGKALAAGSSGAAAAKTDVAKAEEDQLAKVEELRTRYREGKLNTPERVERAAQSILTEE